MKLIIKIIHVTVLCHYFVYVFLYVTKTDYFQMFYKIPIKRNTHYTAVHKTKGNLKIASPYIKQLINMYYVLVFYFSCFFLRAGSGDGGASDKKGEANLELLAQAANSSFNR